jgi:hypothetical protein
MKNTDKENTETFEPPRTTWGFTLWVLRLIMQKKKYWLLPFWCLLIAVVVMLFLTGNGVLLPAIYMAF